MVVGVAATHCADGVGVFSRLFELREVFEHLRLCNAVFARFQRVLPLLEGLPPHDAVGAVAVLAFGNCHQNLGGLLVAALAFGEHRQPARRRHPVPHPRTALPTARGLVGIDVAVGILHPGVPLQPGQALGDHHQGRVDDVIGYRFVGFQDDDTGDVGHLVAQAKLFGESAAEMVSGGAGGEGLGSALGQGQARGTGDPLLDSFRPDHDVGCHFALQSLWSSAVISGIGLQAPGFQLTFRFLDWAGPPKSLKNLKDSSNSLEPNCLHGWVVG